MKASGISVYKIITPLLILSSCVMVLSFGNQELILPYASQKAEYIENIKIKQKDGRRLLKQNRFWYRSEDAICNIDLFEHKTNTLQGITLYFFNNSFVLTKRVDARSGKWIDNQWHFYDVAIRTFSAESVMDIEMAEEKIIPLKETPDDFKVARREPEEMSYSELNDYITKIERAGYTVPEYIPYLYAKYRSPSSVSLCPSLLSLLPCGSGGAGVLRWGSG